MKRKMKLLLANVLIAAVTLIIGCPLWWIGIIDYCKTAVLQSPLFARRITRVKGEKGEQLI